MPQPQAQSQISAHPPLLGKGAVLGPGAALYRRQQDAIQFAAMRLDVLTDSHHDASHTTIASMAVRAYLDHMRESEPQP